MKSDSRIAGSYKDPSGYLFQYKNTLYRRIKPVYHKHYRFLKKSGLYKKLVSKNLLIPHHEVKLSTLTKKTQDIIIKPDVIPFISYPFEWTFSALKQAALTTLEILKISLKHNMILKDASAYNIQFIGTKAVLIDTLSFETYEKGMPWIGYRQFCEHFLAPLTLAAKKDLRLLLLQRMYLDGIPLDLTNKLLPIKSWLSFSLLTHLHLHGLSQKHFSSNHSASNNSPKISSLGLESLIDSLLSATNKLEIRLGKSEWSNYYNQTNYSSRAFENKKILVRKYLKKIKPKTVLDAGANTGIFSQISADLGAYTVSFDNDPTAVELNFLSSIKESFDNILPLVVDLTNPSPDLGWQNKERACFIKREEHDAILALALVHHLAIGKNLPLEYISNLFKDMGKHLIIEFVPKSDSQCQKLLSSRKDIFDSYNKKHFEKIFSKSFSIISSDTIKNTKRTLYLMKRK